MKPLTWIPLLLLLCPSLQAQDASIEDLLERLDVSSNSISGTWALTKGELRVQPEKQSRIILRESLDANYDLRLEFTRVRGDDSVVVILPMGSVSPALELSAWQGEAHGLSRLQSRSSRDPENPTSVQPGNLENGRRYQLDVSVRTQDETASVQARLDGAPLFTWEGAVSDLEPNLALNLPSSSSLGLAAQNCEVVFHRALLKVAAPRPASMPESPKTPTSKPGSDSMDLTSLAENGTPGWEPFNGAAFRTAVDGGRTVLVSRPEAGAKDRGAFLTGVDFSEGIIEVELKGSAQKQGSFLGVVFHGVDGANYDAVYFRPFNFGEADSVRRGHAVQYMSHPIWPWDRLRREQPEVYENPAKPEPASDEWFRVRVVVKDRRIRVFINDSEQPTLDVEKLGSLDSGKVGIWFNGTASFANFRVQQE